MKINALRRELNSLLQSAAGGRKPAVRRSLKDGWLYAADLPAAMPQEEQEAVCARLREAGWECAEDGGWVLFRTGVSGPPEGWFDGPFGPEAACCRSLLSRHPERRKEPDRRIGYALIRAGEEGAEAYEAACRRLHGELAERLRKRQELPDISLDFFGRGV